MLTIPDEHERAGLRLPTSVIANQSIASGRKLKQVNITRMCRPLPQDFSASLEQPSLLLSARDSQEQMLSVWLDNQR
jgi:hypothetical protein